MSNYRAYYPRDDAQPADGDTAFLGVDMRRDPSQLAPGMCARAVNMRFTNGVAAPRKGVRKLTQFGAWFPLEFPIDFNQAIPFGIVMQGAAAFDDPDERKWFVVVADGKPQAVYPGILPFDIPLPAGETIDGEVFMVQAMGRFFLFRGADQSPLVMDDVTAGFTVVDDKTSAAGNGTGTLTIPNSNFALFFQNRLIIAQGRDEVVWSDILNESRYSITNSGRINKGSSDKLTGIYEWNDTSIIVAKERSIYAVSNLVPDDQGNWSSAQLEVISKNWGILAPKSMCQVGNDLWGLSHRGIVSIRQTETNKIQAVDLPVSDAIQPLINRINWSYAHRAVSRAWNNRVYFALPIDSACKQGVDFIDEAVFDGAGEVTLQNLVVGATYRYTKGTETGNLLNGTTVYPTSRDFVAEDPIATLQGTPGEVATSTLRRLYLGINNAVAVYDTLNKAWAGWDEGDALMVLDWLDGEYFDEQRLCFISDDGFLHVYEEGNEDDHVVEVSKPEYELRVTQCPQVGDTLTVSGGTTITVTSAETNTATTWGCADLLTAQKNLWEDEYGTGGFKANWSAPNTTSTQLANGVAIRSTLAGVPPTIETTGSTWKQVLTNKGHALVRQPIATEFVSRGYMPATDATAPEVKTAPKIFRTVAMNLKTRCPALTVSAQVDGHEETIELGQVRRDRTKWFEHDRDDCDPMNGNDDFAEQGRQDYSIQLNDGDELDLQGGGLDPEIYQESAEKWKVNTRGKYLQVAVDGHDGQAQITSIVVAGSDGPRRAGVVA